MAGTAVVVSLTGETDAAAGFYIPLAPPSAQKIFPHSFKISYANYTRTADFAHCKFLVFCSLQPTKSACSAAAEKCLSGVGQPLSSVSGRKRYNTLDFASKIVCQQGCFSPLLETQSRGIASLWTPAYFPRKWYPNCKNAV